VLNLRQFEILRAIMRCRTTIGAAHELGMSQPAVSNALKGIEAQLRFRLFDRISNRLVPTEEARLLAAEAEPLFAMHQALNHRVDDLGAGRIGRVRVLVTSELSELLLPHVMRRFVEAHPDVSVSIDTSRLDAVLDGIEMGVADFGLAIGPHPRPGLVYEPLMELEMVCASPSGSATAELPTVTAADLKDARLIGPPPGSPLSALLEEEFRKVSATFSPTIDVRFMNIAAHLVEAGVGVAIVDELTASYGHFSNLRMSGFSPRIPIMLQAILPRDKPLQRLARSFIEHVHLELAAMARIGTTEGRGLE
jgi:DNA-binding transcriptional LysR family regulator